ncbi:MAG: WecB/TagA/CpsF family glycosyltransferase [Bacteroidota bacterium]|nr:WecB/TagA/CpsF family glycosyltransferase [Bacteroidota bacterium]
MSVVIEDIQTKNRVRKIVDLNITPLTYDEVLDKIFSLASSRMSSYICFANAHMAVEARLNKNIAQSVNDATIVTSDGMSVVMALKYLHKVKQDRTSGMDMIFDVIKGAEDKNLSIFLFGTNDNTLSQFISKARKNHPKLNIAGAIAPPYSDFTKEENDKFVETIKSSGADIVFVGLGCPKQELWMAENSHKINAVMLGFGAAFSLYANKLKRAPEFMQKYCLEWMYRLYQEPKRLWKRYLVTNTLFLIYFVRQLLQKR